MGLEEFARRFPDRVFDVGIAEQHALTMAAGLAYAGLHPVVCVYATFLNRAFDQLLMDCAMHRAGVTVVLDRAGAVSYTHLDVYKRQASVDEGGVTWMRFSG